MEPVMNSVAHLGSRRHRMLLQALSTAAHLAGAVPSLHTTHAL